MKSKVIEQDVRGYVLCEREPNLQEKKLIEGCELLNLSGGNLFYQETSLGFWICYLDDITLCKGSLDKEDALAKAIVEMNRQYLWIKTKLDKFEKLMSE